MHPHLLCVRLWFFVWCGYLFSKLAFQIVIGIYYLHLQYTRYWSWLFLAASLAVKRTSIKCESIDSVVVQSKPEI